MVVKAKTKEDPCFQFWLLALKSDNGAGLNEGLMSEIEVHLLCLKEEFSRYFPDISYKLFPLVKFLFTFDFDKIPEIAQEELIEITNDTGIKSEYE
jgi:hypothetical protein